MGIKRRTTVALQPQKIWRKRISQQQSLESNRGLAHKPSDKITDKPRKARPQNQCLPGEVMPLGYCEKFLP